MKPLLYAIGCALLLWGVFRLSGAVDRVVEELAKDCVVAGTIPEKPKGPGTWRLTWERVKR